MSQTQSSSVAARAPAKHHARRISEGPGEFFEEGWIAHAIVELQRSTLTVYR